MEISLGVVLEDVAYLDRDIRGSCSDIVVYSTGSGARAAIGSIWRLCLDDILNPFVTGF